MITNKKEAAATFAQMKCQRCGRAPTEGEAFEMAKDIHAVVRLVEAIKLKRAIVWNCVRCCEAQGHDVESFRS